MFPQKMYLSDSEEEDIIIKFKKPSKVTFNETLNEVYYISAEEYLLEPRKSPPNKWLETFLKFYY